MFIPEDKISEILHISDIVDVISETVMLKKSGRNFFGLCPFHPEKTPSFSVNPDKQIFHCFGCSEGGNAISFVMKYHGISFPEAARMLARRYQIEVETKDMDPVRKKEIQVRESLFRLNRKIMGMFSQAVKDGKAGAPVREYLEKRGMTAETIDEFQLGYAPDAWDTVVNALKKARVTREVALQSGLVLPRKQGNGYYDRFRNRLMFPIFDINMQVAGFGGRVMDDSMPKYMNSPETPVYSKGRILYGLHAAKQECRKQNRLFIVEGYFDFLSLYQSGIKNTVASLGTALTSDHVRILKGYAGQMILVFDSDAAGINAAKRSIQIFMKEGVDTRIMVLGGKHDPDSFVREKGAKAFLEMANDARSVMQFLLQLAMDTHGPSVEGRVKTLEEIRQYLAMIQDPALRSLYIKELAEALNIDENAVLEKVREEVARQQSKTGSLTLKEADTEKTVVLESDPREKQILSILLLWPEFISLAKEKKVVDAFLSPQLRKLGKIILETPETPDNFVSAVMSRVGEEAQKAVAAMAIEDLSGIDAQTAGMLMDRILKLKHKSDTPLVNRMIREKKGCDADVMALLKQKQQQIQQLNNR